VLSNGIGRHGEGSERRRVSANKTQSPHFPCPFFFFLPLSAKSERARLLIYCPALSRLISASTPHSHNHSLSRTYTSTRHLSISLSSLTNPPTSLFISLLLELFYYSSEPLLAGKDGPGGDYGTDKTDDARFYMGVEKEKLMNTQEEGLTELEALRRLELFGPNKLREKEHNLSWKLFLEFVQPMPMMIWMAIAIESLEAGPYTSYVFS